MPFDNIAKRHFDSGDYPEALRRAIDAIAFDRVRERQASRRARRPRIGIGFGMYAEQAGHGTSVYAAWGIPFVPGFEQAQARFTPDGGLELRIGAHSHGQGLETTLSQVAPFHPRRPARSHPAGARRHGRDALLHRHLGLALHDHVGRGGRCRV
jgi:carbon-monoxide dehydrogenase large subunit